MLDIRKSTKGDNVATIYGDVHDIQKLIDTLKGVQHGILRETDASFADKEQRAMLVKVRVR